MEWQADEWGLGHGELGVEVQQLLFMSLCSLLVLVPFYFSFFFKVGT